eukprot:GFUD01000055.1.p1 GENE.GFUD01000055.1~~GFUD01000055.1.p1  ORF type:complete len:260 (-),score=57.82 GFUD01000055.1:16-795(-)
MAVPKKIAQCLDPSSGLPTDVRFFFKDVHDGNKVKEVRAHKLILAIASDVFKRGLFGPMKGADEDIEIKDATQEVFKSMVDFVYNKQLDWKDYDLDFLSSLYYLGEKYFIEELKKDILTFIPQFEVSMENVREVAILAEQNIHHQPFSEALYDTLATFLKIKFNGNLMNALDFCLDYEATEAQGLVLFEMIVLSEPKCANCQKSSCLNGQNVTVQNYVPGSRVVPNQRIAIVFGCSEVEKLVCVGWVWFTAGLQQFSYT